jgi:ATP synthase protein I
VNPSNQTSEEANLTVTEDSQKSSETNSMADYYQLKQNLLLVTLALTGVIFISVWWSYSLTTGLNYLLGAGVGLVYLRMLAKDVERIGVEGQRISSNRLGLFAILIIVATQWQQLQVLPIFLGFITYKGSLIVYTLQTLFGEMLKK